MTLCAYFHIDDTPWLCSCTCTSTTIIPLLHNGTTPVYVTVYWLLIFMLVTLEITRKHRYFVVKNITFIYFYKMETIMWQEFSRLFLFKFFEFKNDHMTVLVPVMHPLSLTKWEFNYLLSTVFSLGIHGFLASRGRTSTRVAYSSCKYSTLVFIKIKLIRQYYIWSMFANSLQNFLFFPSYYCAL